MSYINNALRRNRSEIIHLLLLPSVPKLMPELQNHLSALKTASLTYPDRLAFRIAHKASDADTVASWERISFQQFYQDVENAAKYWLSELSSRGLAPRSVVGLW